MDFDIFEGVQRQLRRNRRYTKTSETVEKPLASGVVSKTANYTLTSADSYILADATSGSITITLPAVSGISGRIYTIKRTDSSANTVTIDGNASETIDDQTTQTLSQYDTIKIICDGTEWWII